MNHLVLIILTFLIIGICVIIIFINYHKKNYKEDKNYLVEGMCLGMSLGVAVSVALKINIGLGIGLGMLVGETVGLIIKKK